MFASWRMIVIFISLEFRFFEEIGIVFIGVLIANFRRKWGF